MVMRTKAVFIHGGWVYGIKRVLTKPYPTVLLKND